VNSSERSLENSEKCVSPLTEGNSLRLPSINELNNGRAAVSELRVRCLLSGGVGDDSVIDSPQDEEDTRCYRNIAPHRIPLFCDLGKAI
jgi:hypothetical protein